MPKLRNEKIDIVRGFAAVVVVMGHVLYRFNGYNDNLLFNIIFSFQMPLFMMISGYTCIYASPVHNIRTWLKHFLKRCRTLLLPWFVWSVIAYVFLSNLPLNEYVAETIRHMESAFWFLFSLWTIDLVFSMAQLIVANVFKNKSEVLKSIGLLPILALLFVPIILVGLKYGITFLAIKYTLYYSLFYVLGYFYGRITRIKQYRKYEKLRDALLCGLMIAYVFLITRFNVIDMPEQIVFIAVRVFISICACLIIFEVINNMDIKENRTTKTLKMFGNLSLELYVVHYFVVKWLDVEMYNINTVIGFCVALIYFGIVLALSYFIIVFIKQSVLARCILFGKK